MMVLPLGFKWNLLSQLGCIAGIPGSNKVCDKVLYAGARLND